MSVEIDRDVLVRLLLEGAASTALQRDAAHELERAWEAEARIHADFLNADDRLRDTQRQLQMALSALKASS